VDAPAERIGFEVYLAGIMPIRILLKYFELSYIDVI